MNDDARRAPLPLLVAADLSAERRSPFAAGPSSVTPALPRRLSDRWVAGMAQSGWRYPLAAALVILAFIVRDALLPGAGDKSPFQTFGLAVLASAVIGGFGPGAFATCLGAVAAAYQYLPPLEHLAVDTESDVLRLALFLIEGTLAATAGEALRRTALRERERARATAQLRRFLDTARGSTSVVSDDEVLLVETLSGREVEIVRLLLLGLGNEQIGSRMYISTNTVKTHLAHVYGKLGVHSRTEAVARALQLGLLADDEPASATRPPPSPPAGPPPIRPAAGAE